MLGLKDMKLKMISLANLGKVTRARSEDHRCHF